MWPLLSHFLRPRVGPCKKKARTNARQPAPDAESRKPGSAKPKQSPVPLCAPVVKLSDRGFPESRLPRIPKSPTISFVRKILLTSPSFPRLYADIVLATRPNSNEAKILRPHYQKT